jgi:hypothetical protein
MAAVALTEAMMLSSLGPISDTTHKTTIVRLVLSSANPMVVIRLLHDTQISRTTTLPKVVFCCLDPVHWWQPGTLRWRFLHSAGQLGTLMAGQSVPGGGGICFRH